MRVTIIVLLLVFSFLFVSTLSRHHDHGASFLDRHRRATKIICMNGKEVNGACVCDQGFSGAHCEKKMHCLSYERNRNGTCISCKDNYFGERCDQMKCENGQEDENEQKCICEKPYTGAFCDELITKDVYYYYNSRVAQMGPLGCLILIPMFLVYYGCEHFAKKRQVRRIEKTLVDQTNVSVDSDRIKSLLDEKA